MHTHTLTYFVVHRSQTLTAYRAERLINRRVPLQLTEYAILKSLSIDNLNILPLPKPVLYRKVDFIKA